MLSQLLLAQFSKVMLVSNEEELFSNENGLQGDFPFALF